MRLASSTEFDSGPTTSFCTTRYTAAAEANRVKKLSRKIAIEFELAVRINCSVEAVTENAPHRSPFFMPSLA